MIYITAGSSDIYVVKDDQWKTNIIAKYSRCCKKEIDLENEKIVVYPIKGLLD